MDSYEAYDWVTVQGEAGPEQKRVGLFLSFAHYSEKEYLEDFAEWARYQQRKETLLPGESDLKFFNVNPTEPIPFETFKRLSGEYLAKVMLNLLKTNPGFVISTELIVRIKVIRIPGRQYYFEYKMETDESEEGCFSDPENALFDGAGIWFLQAIVGPLVYLHRIDFTFIYRYFLHELQHQVDFMRRWAVFNERYEEKFKRMNARYSAANFLYLYTSLFMLREEGLPELSGRRHSPVLDIDMDGVREYNRNMERLAGITSRWRAKKFYEEQIGYMNLTPSGEYANGRMMCVTIAIALAKHLKKELIVKSGDREYWGESIDYGALLRERGKLTVIRMPNDLVEFAIQYIGPYNHYYFLGLYERACEQLGIGERLRIMTKRRFFSLKRTALARAEKVQRQRLAREGYGK